MSRWARVGGGAAAVALVGLGVAWLLRGAEDPTTPDASPLLVPPGEATRLTLPDAEGKAQEWTFTRRESTREEAVPSVLPDPAPRETTPDERTESARALDAEALEAWRAGDLREAVDLFEAAVASDPDDWVPRSNYGRLLLMMTDLQGAQPHLQRAAELAPDNPRVWLDLLTLYQRSVVPEGAFEARRRAEETAGARRIVQDELTGLWKLEGESIFP